MRARIRLELDIEDNESAIDLFIGSLQLLGNFGTTYVNLMVPSGTKIVEWSVRKLIPLPREEHDAR